MAKRSSPALDSGFFLQLSLGLFFLALGVMGLGNYKSGLSEIARFLGRDDTLRIVSAIIEMAMGGVLVLGLFMPLSSGLAKILSISLFALWALYIVYYFFLNDRLFEPDFIPWLVEVSWRCVILAALWVTGRKYM
jgi:uncharacterized membrane protein